MHQNHAVMRSRCMQFFGVRGILQHLLTWWGWYPTCAWRGGVARGVNRHWPLEQKWTPTPQSDLNTFIKMWWISDSLCLASVLLLYALLGLMPVCLSCCPSFSSTCRAPSPRCKNVLHCLSPHQKTAYILTSQLSGLSARLSEKRKYILLSVSKRERERERRI